MKDFSASPTVEELRRALADLDPGSDNDPSTHLQALVRRGFDRLPMPGSGGTLTRWQALAAVAEHDLSLAKLYEGHTDAIAILAELQGGASASASTSTGAAAASPADAGATWGVWAAEAPRGRTLIGPGDDGRVLLNGAKCWCSGAATLSHGLLTAWHADGRGPQLVRVAMHQPGVAVNADAWRAVGMAGSASIDVAFSGAVADRVGVLGEYLSRPGFWHGGAGIAACWYGGAVALGAALRQSLIQAPSAGRSAFKSAALGKVDLSLHRTATLLREAAQWIDSHPLLDASAVALRVRLAAEETARCVLDEAGRALGAAAFCHDARFARMAADLPVFIRQSHGESDFAALGERMVAAPGSPWWL